MNQASRALDFLRRRNGAGRAIRSGSFSGIGAPSSRRRGVLAVLALALLALCVVVAPTSAAPPTVVMGTVSAVDYTSAHVSGEIDPQGEFVEFWFEVSTDGVSWERKSSAGLGGSGLQPVQADVKGLKGGTTYFVRLSAMNYTEFQPFTSAGPNPSFTTDPVAAPTAAIDPVTTFGTTTAHFSGQVNPNAPEAAPTSASVEAAFSTSWQFVCDPSCPGLAGTVAADDSSHTVEVDATGLEPNVSYEVKLVATNAGGSDADQTSFQTDPVVPVAETVPAFALGNGTEALLGGRVNPRNSATTYWVEYGPGPGGASPAYPNSVPATKDAPLGAGGQPVFAIQKIAGLSPASTYHFRIVAENAAGTTLGDDVSFETSPLPEPPAECPNAKLRTETDSAALPECRAYEMTTEPDKIGGDIWGASTTSADGNRVGYVSPAAFGDSRANAAGNSYIAQRGASGWTTQSLVPAPGSPGIGFNGGYPTVDFSSDLLSGVLATDNVTAGEPKVANVLLVKPGGSATWVTAPTVPGAQIFPKAYAGSSADASHVIFESPEEFVPGAANGQTQVWEWFDGQVRLVSAREDGSPFPNGGVVGAGFNGSITLGTTFDGTLPEPTVVSADGSRIFFSEGVGPGPSGVYVREDGLHTRALSVSQRAGSIGQFDGSAHFAAAALDGSRVYMRSPQQLTDDATPGGGLHSYNLETDSMHFVGAVGTDASSWNAEGALLVSEDGTRAYFTSPELLVPGKGVDGARNLYTANDEGGEVAFVGTLDPLGLSLEPSYMKATPDGGDFAFDSTARLTAYDNAGHREVYLYDAAAGSLRCASCRPDGQAAEGDVSLRFAPVAGSITFGRPRAITSDGGSVFFETRDGLLPGDVNGVRDVYQYRDGRVSMISSGTSPFDSQIVDNSPDGRNVFFTTRDPLVGQDIDASRDIYDARVEGGFPAPVPRVSPCEGEACQGQAHPAPGFASPGTASLSGRGNSNGRGKHKACGRKHKKQRSKCGGKKHQARTISKSGRGK